MSNQKGTNSLLSGRGRTGHIGSKKDEILAMKYSMEKPLPPVYPLDDKLIPKSYPDYAPWSDDETENDKLKNSGFLNKGYFESPLVSNEYYSARNLIQETLFLSTKNCTAILKELSQHFTKAYKTRNEVINKIRYDSNNFKVPPRVTLTAAKKEAWLKDLGNPDVPLQAVSSKLPHGIRNKVLVDCMCNMNIPISRAIWFTKCTLYSELLILRKKFNSKQSSLPTGNSISLPPIEIFENRWLQEWSQQVSDYIFKFAKGMDSVNTPEKQLQFSSKLNYLLSYVQTLYLEDLLDKSHFISAVIKFFRDDLPLEYSDVSNLLELSRAEMGEDSFQLKKLLQNKTVTVGQILVGLTIIKTFWKNILSEDFLCKFLSESLLLNYFLLERLPVYPTKQYDVPQNVTLLPSKLKHDLLEQLGATIVLLFKHNTNLFIFPNYWTIVGDILLKILLRNENLDSDTCKKLHRVLQLLNYRNESLMLNMQSVSISNDSSVSKKAGRRSSFLDMESLNRRENIEIETRGELNHELTVRSPEDNLRFIEQLDRLQLNNSLAARLRPYPSTSFESNSWRQKIKISVYWCVSVHRNMGMSSEKILIFCNFLKRKVLQAVGPKGATHLKAEFENELLESIFSLGGEPKENLTIYNLYVLINELYQLKIISISSYIRKLIACGIFYNSPPAAAENGHFPGNEQINFHLAILMNLPVLNNRQCDHILQKWTPDGFKFSSFFSRGIELLQTNILDRLINNSFGTYFDSSFDEIQEFNVGVKFLLVNWLTTQFKVTIHGAPKLVHLTPNIVAHIYHFYSITDNLTVFFKVFVKFVLRNENKIIIFYLETLYFICKLIMHHYTLVKFISGNSYESVSTAYELFKLIIANYNDLLTRETDTYRFSEVWNFINSSMEKVFEGDKEMDPQKLYFDKILYERETADSPLKVQAHHHRENDVYSIDLFKNDLTNLMSIPESILSVEEINDIVGEIKPLDATLRQFSDENIKLEEKIITALEEWYLRITMLKENEDQAFFKLLETTRRKLKSSSPRSFSNLVKSFVRSKIEVEMSPDKLSIFLKKLLTYELFSLDDLILFLRGITYDNINEKVVKLITSISLGDTPLNSLFCYQYLMFKEIQFEYQAKNFEDIIIHSVEGFQSDPDFMNSENMVKYGDKIIDAMKNGLIFNRIWTINFINEELAEDQILQLYNRMLSSPLSLINDVESLGKFSNEFTLPIAQALLCSLGRSYKSNYPGFGAVAGSAMKFFHFQFGTYNSFVGEVYNFLDWSNKIQVFQYLETVFLTETQFYSEWGVEDAMTQEGLQSVSLWKSNEGLELIPAFKDYFKKFSISSVEKITTSVEQFQQFQQFLSKLVQLLDNEITVQQDENLVYDVVSIFLKLLIIHKTTLTPVIVEHDAINFTFLKNLILMLNTRYLTMGHEKLKILLHDLLLLMKSSLAQQLRLGHNDGLGNNTANLQIPANDSGTEDKKDGTANPENSEFAGDALAALSSILDLPEPATDNPFYDSNGMDQDCAFGLDDDELYYSSDVGHINNYGLLLASARRDSIAFSSPFGSTQRELPIKPFTIKSMKLIEDTGTGLNDGCINLSLFEAYTTRENPT